ncbi:MAG: ABC transporter ATP-binding protein [Promethearchaeota archaeon]
MKKKVIQEKVNQSEELDPEEAKRLEEIDKERQLRPIGPVMGRHRGPMAFMDDKVKLEHPRGVLWRWIFSYLFRQKKLFVFYAILIAIGSVINIITPLLTRILIDSGIIARNTQVILNITILYISLLIIMALGNYMGSSGLGKIGQNVVFSMRNDVFEQLQKMSMSYFDKHPSGDVISRATNDIDQVNLLLGGQLVQVITSIISLTLTIIFMFVLSPFLALFGLIVFPVFFFMSKWFRSRVIGAFKETRRKISKVTSSIQENIAGAKTVQAFGQEKKALNEFDQANIENAEASFRARRIFATFFPLITFLSSVMTASVLVIGGYVSLINFAPFGIAITVGTLAAFIQYMSTFFQPFMTLTQIQQVIESAMASADRIYAILDEEVDLPDPEHPIVIQNPKGSIEFEDVSFGYKFNGTQELEAPSKKSFKIPKPIHKSVDSKKIVNEEAQKIPVAFNPMQMMQRAQHFFSTLSEPYKTFFEQNFIQVPPEIRQEMMMGLTGTPPDEITTKIDSIFAKHGFAIPETQQSKEHPELNTTFPEAFKPPIIAGGRPLVKNKGPAGDSAKISDNSQKPNVQTMPPFFQGIINNPKAINRMIKGLEMSLKGHASIQRSGGVGSGMGGETGGMMGSGGGMGGRFNPTQILRMLAMMSLPEEITKDFPEIVKKAIEEERILIEHETMIGYVLKHVDLKVDEGKTIAIVGRTGAGKTTVIKLTCRFYDVTDGEVLIDGVNVKDLDKKNLRNLIGLVPQDSFLFSGTIRDNLLYGYDDDEYLGPEMKDVIEKKMIDVSKFLGLHNFIETLPKKYDTKLKENASNISIGQRQLIAFARALIQNPKILILDEATSSVDPYTESLIQDALDRAREGRTTIIIAHRLSTIKNADWIVVLDQDKKGIVEQGTHEQLVAKENGVYKHLLDMQYKDIMVENTES